MNQKEAIVPGSWYDVLGVIYASGKIAKACFCLGVDYSYLGEVRLINLTMIICANQEFWGVDRLMEVISPGGEFTADVWRLFTGRLDSEHKAYVEKALLSSISGLTKEELDGAVAKTIQVMGGR